MDSSTSAIVFIAFILSVFLIYAYFQCKIKRKEHLLIREYQNVPMVCDGDFLICIPQRQQEQIYNISRQVQGHNQGQTLPNDAYVTIEHIMMNNQLNKPSPNDDPPSYEEAIKLPTTSHTSSNIPQVHAPKTTN